MESYRIMISYYSVMRMSVNEYRKRKFVMERMGDEELNAVRFRVGMLPRKATLENILAERQLELAWEGWRRQDLVRFGKFTRPYTDRPQLPHESNGYTTVFPIPDKVRSLNPNLTQNPGY